MKKQENKKDYPGYPHYPAKEDITRPGNNSGKEEMNEENILLPDTSDIPGQEHISPAPLGKLADSTPSSADEEDIISGDSLDKGEDDLGIVPGTDADVTEADIHNLEMADLDLGYKDDRDIEHLGVDNRDEDGELLNEGGSPEDLGKDLDIPGSELDDSDEAIGEEDEENNL